MNAGAWIATMVALAIGAAAPAARAVDGCVVLLCLAGNWSAIGQCVPPVEQLFADLALGQPFPTCAFASVPSAPTGTSPAVTAATPTTNASGPTPAVLEAITQQNCPVQYAIVLDGQFVSCSGYLGLIRVTVNGLPWSLTLWSPGGASVTCFSSTRGTRFDFQRLRSIGWWRMPRRQPASRYADARTRTTMTCRYPSRISSSQCRPKLARGPWRGSYESSGNAPGTGGSRCAQHRRDACFESSGRN